jgi:transcriptional regulator with GAF, ATPase, and Fis domain
MHDDPEKHPKTLPEAQVIIERQAAEIEGLRRGLGDERVAEELRNALRLATTAGTIASPLRHHQLLTRIVETAAKVINAHYGSLFLLDEETHELVFEVSLRESVEELKPFRIPLGHGIAGLVAATGQPMAISDASSSDLHASDLASGTGYMPESIVCVPLNHNDQVIGVLQLLDKIGSESFAAEDIDRLALFANLAAITIEQSRTQHSLVRLLGEVLIASGDPPDTPSGELRTWGDSFAREIEDESSFLHALDLARLVHEIAQFGDHELAATRAILESFAAYLRTRPTPELMFGTHR